MNVAVVGGGPAGFTVIRELRARGFGGAITLIDPEGLPYDRPPLSKGYLAGTLEDPSFVDETTFAELDVQLIPARAQSLDPDVLELTLDDGNTLTADRIVLATGAQPRSLPIPGADLPGVLTLRTRADADTLRARLRPGHRLVIIGAGLIGAEVASIARGLGADVTLVDPAALPLSPAVGDQLAVRLHQMHADHGVTTIQALPTAIRSEDGLVVELGDPELGNRELPADTVLVAIGVQSHDELATSAGLEVIGGVVVDEQARTSRDGVLAVGDAARPRRADGTLAMRPEHWEHAIRSAAVAAALITDTPPPDATAPWFWSDRYGVHVEAVGTMASPTRGVLRESARGVAAFALAGDRLVGAAAIDDSLAIRAARRLIDRAIPVNADDLADPAVDLRTLVRGRSR